MRYIYPNTLSSLRSDPVIKIGLDTVLTCSPGAWRRIKDDKDPADVYKALKRYLRNPEKTRQIRNASELAFCIAERCTPNLFDSNLTYNHHYDFMEIFRRSIAVAMDKQSSLFSKISDEDERGTFFKEGFGLLEEVKDI
ncbi:hypothetical protein TWF506_005370 [Arthrobotrys conoides]|uniref:Uncharacterized protein n=1 Tax=Arthrobotrys conoides TaxID=74498 RepID=A0AAN8NJI2_9PEZI